MGLNYEKVKKFWEIRAGLAGEKLAVNLGTNEAQSAAQLEKIFSALGPSDRKIMDLGCGTGRLALPLAEAGKQVTAVDYVEPLLAALAEEAKNKGLQNIQTFCAACTDPLPVAYGSFDAVLISGLMTYLNDPEVDLLIANAARLIRPEGKIIVRESVGTQGRFEVDKFSEELKAEYQAIYRPTEDIEARFGAKGFFYVRSEKLYQQRKETGTWFWIFKRQAETHSG